MIKRWRFAAGVLAGLLLCFTAEAKVDLCVILRPWTIPAAYSSGPYRAPPEIREVTLRRIQTICAGAGRRHMPNGDKILGCSQLLPEKCLVHVPIDVKPLLPELFNWIVRHELAHCRGWTHKRY